MMTHPNPTRILLADDDRESGAVLGEFLGEHGFRCELVMDADSAMVALRWERFDLLVSDISMPGNEGLELIRWLHRNVVGLPVILLTGFATLQTAIESSELPVVAYLTKPPRYDRLLQLVVRETNRYRCFRALKLKEARLRGSLAALRSMRSADALRDEARQGERGEVNRQLDQVLEELQGLVEAYDGIRLDDPESPQPPKSFQPNVLENALRETVEALQRTRDQFKSRELGQLRRHLERILGET